MARGSNELAFDAPREEVWLAIANAMSDLRYKIRESDPETGYIEASAGATFLSWGQHLRISLSESDGVVVVSVSSRTYWFQLVDWGDGARRRREILERTQSLLVSHEPTESSFADGAPANTS